jgi:dTDP-4-dehydrorhamnose 3,5-epimerase
MNRSFDNWNEIKKKLSNSKVNFQFKQRDIFFMSLGKNIGFEQNGQGIDFKRPVLVYKKFNKFIFLGIPLTSKIKEDIFHTEFEYKNGTRSFAILSQMKLFDIRRALYYDGKISKNMFEQVQNDLLNLIVTPLQKKWVCTKAICDNIVSKKITDVNNIFSKAKIEDVIIIESKVHGDSRGYFVETFRQDKLEEFVGYKINFCQDNESKSSKGVLRGLHYQLPPFAQTKLVRVIQGKVLDVAVDIRYGSPTFGQYVAVELSGENKKQLLIPRGFAHGFVVLEDDTIFSYKVDNYYSPQNDRGIAFDDEDLGIDWILKTDELNLSAKDKIQPKLKDTNDLFDYGVNLYE